MAVALHDFLDELLHSRTARTALAAGELPDLVKEDLEAALALDQQELAQTAKSIRRRILFGTHQGGRGMCHVFSNTLAICRQKGISDDALVTDFLESLEFNQSRSLPFAGPGTLLEQAFYDFVKRTVLADLEPLESVARNEFLTQLFRRIDPVLDEQGFGVPSQWVRRNPVGYHSVQRYNYWQSGNTLSRRPHYVLYARTKSEQITGEISPLTAELLEETSPTRSLGRLAMQYDCPVTDVLAVHQHLVGTGLLS